MITRLLALFFIIMGALLLPWWAVLVGAIIYTSRYRGLELIAIMIFIDSYYGAFSRIPLLTVGVTAVVLVMTVVRPSLRTQTHTL